MKKTKPAKSPAPRIGKRPASPDTLNASNGSRSEADAFPIRIDALNREMASPNPVSQSMHLGNPMANMLRRPRRNRRTASLRALLRETELTPAHFILPLFVMEGKNQRIPVRSMPGVERLSRDLILKEARRALSLGIGSVALFPVLADNLKDAFASTSTLDDGLLQRTIRDLKNALPEITVITDVAMDPYSSDGHDGLVYGGKILNDESLPILAAMALSQARAGADIVAPSDMMDGRVGYLRRSLDAEGFNDTGILAYTAKYASSFYGPFREALDSAPKHGDKKTYQMDPANRREALVEAELDVREGADIVMVKPALAYLDVIAAVKAAVNVPVAAYHVSGEYAMVKAAGQLGWLDADAAMLESLMSIRRAGADAILTYAAMETAQRLQG
ncbi:MAG: delta-aminolevulinic acid dehydratase [Fibrobacteres bacterium]|nr:delta-aminolevulinic acid dehydratase [Fibrobacterota bacterium]